MSVEPRRRHKIRWLWIALPLVAVVASLGWWYRASHAAGKITYETAAVSRGDVTSKVTSTGTLQAVTKVTVGSQVSGIIDHLYVDFNSRVKKDQVLAQIDPSLFRAELSQSQASLNNTLGGYNSAVANAGNALSGVKAAEAGIASARSKMETARAALANALAALGSQRANVRRAQASLVNARRNYDRFAALLKKDLVARGDVDTAQTQYLVAEADLQAVKGQVDAARATHRSALAGVESAKSDLEAAAIRRESAVEQLKASQAQVKSAEAQVSQARANVESAKVNLSRTTIRSPIDGVVLARNVSLGQTVAAQFQAPDLFTLAENLEQMQVETSVDEADIGRVKEGAHVTFTVDAYPSEEFEGNVTSIRQSPTTVQNVVTYQVIVRCVNKGLKLKPGMTATVSIQEKTRKDVVLLPNAALRFKPPESDEKKPSGSPSTSPSPSPTAAARKPSKHGARKVPVYTVSPTDATKLVEHPLVLGISDGSNTEVLEGDLKSGDAVVTASSEDNKTSANKSRMRFF